MIRPAVGRAGSRSAPRRDKGASVVETALSIPALLMVALVLLWGLLAGSMNVRLAVAANDLARDLARGTSAEEALGRFHTQLPQAEVSIDDQAEMVHVIVRRNVATPLSALGQDVMLEQQAVAMREMPAS